MNDLISRQAAIESVSEACFEWRGIFGRCENALKALPSVQTVNPYKIVLEDLKQVPMFTGKYDAKNGNIHFMYGISTVLEYIADKAGDEEYEGMFLDNLNKSAYGDKAE